MAATPAPGKGIELAPPNRLKHLCFVPSVPFVPFAAIPTAEFGLKITVPRCFRWN
jgi:hypothetical protein